MTKGYTVFASDEARKEYEKRPKQARRKKECPACEIKAEIISVKDDIVIIDKDLSKGDKR